MVNFGLGAEDYDRQYKDLHLIKKIGHYGIKYKKNIIIAIIFLVLEQISVALQPVYVYFLLVRLETNPMDNFILAGILIFLLIHFITWLFSAIRQAFMARIINNMKYDLRKEIFDHVLIQDMAFFDKFETGKIVSRINMDTENFGEMISISINLVTSIIRLVFVIIPLFIINIRLTSIIMITVPIIFLITFLYRKEARKRTLIGQRSLANVNSFVQESMAGIQIAKTFRQESHLFKEFKEVNQQSYNVNYRRALYLNLIVPSIRFVSGICYAFTIYYGGKLLLNGVLDASDLYLFTRSLWGLFFPIFQLAAFWPQFQTGLASFERSLALIDSQPTVIQENEIIIKPIKGKIDIDNLTFCYSPEVSIFHNFNLQIKPGESVAIVGHTGAGKSSLAKILLRFYEFQKGTILIDDVNIKDLALDNYRSQVGMIPQTPFLWADTLENNVRYGSPHATSEDVMWALNQAGGADWIEDLSEGIQTNIQERGKLLSMGQRQLVVFARVLLNNPSILILDEATASVDPFTETKIQEGLENLMKNRTSIIIAHRLRTIRHVDRIIVLKDGAIIEEGNHEYLMDKGGNYAELYNTYFKHQSYQYLEKMKVET